MKRLFLLITCLLLFPPFVFAGKDPADYPLKVHILQQNWSSHNLRYNEHKGRGRGNIQEGDSLHAFEYTYDCSFPLERTAVNEPYLAKWKKPRLSLALLAAKIGKTDEYQQCELKTLVHEGVYVLGAGGITEMSQEEYKAWKAQRDAKNQRSDAGVPAH